MKRILLFFIFICFACVAYACGKTPPKPSVSPSEVPSVAPSVLPSVLPSVAPSILPTVIPSTPTESVGLLFTLNIEETGYLLSGIGSCADTEIMVPATYQGLPVVGVKEYALQNAMHITRIVLPEGITVIEKFAFSYCTSLCEVILPSTLTQIYSYAFANTSLQRVVFTGGTHWWARDISYGGTHSRNMYVTNPEQNAIDLTGFYVQHEWTFLG
ncbi:MAG: leucine-rich repeat domain-containing protein [Clostridia bacterium]|nr:leucine-rich repeat domain-containing protein [Clostridia bacterium]